MRNLPKTDKDEPKRLKSLIERDAPTAPKSNTANVLPIRAAPTTDKEAPMRANVRSDIALPT
jgi:hypothetical protein